MINTRFALLLLAFISIRISYVKAQPNLKADEKTIAYLNKFRSDYIKSMLEKKPEILRMYYAEKIRLMPEFQKTIMGKDNALHYHKAFAERFDMQEYAMDEIEVLDLGSRVITSGSFSMKMKLKSTSKDYELRGKYQNIWEKDIDKLTLITNAWNHNNRTEIDGYFSFPEIPAVQVAFQAHVPVNNNISFELAALSKLSEVSIIQHDNKIWSQFYTDDAILLPNLSSMHQGRKAIDEYLEKHVKEMPMFEKLDLRNDYIDNLGTYVIEYASHVANWRNGEHSGVNTGKNIRIWRREADGSLKTFRQIGMYD